MQGGGIIADTVFQLGPLQITDTVVTTWVIMSVIAVLGWQVTRRLRIEPQRFRA